MFDELPTHVVEPQKLTDSTEDGDLVVMLATALDHPLDFPAVNEWMFPGDQVAIALQSSLPRPVEVALALLDYCQSNSVELDDVLLVIAPTMAAQFGIDSSDLDQTEAEIASGQPPKTLPVTVGSHKIACQVHDQNNSYGLAYLAVNEAGDPVHVNRQLVDADVVIPVGCPTSGSNSEPRDCIYPDFGSSERAEPFRALTGSVVDRAQEVKLANDNLGSFFSLQIVFSPGGDVSHVVAGERQGTLERATQLANQQWMLEPADDVDLVIATIEEPGREQSWSDFASALIVASQAGGGTGPIVVWSSIRQSPDRNTRKSLQRQFDDGGTRKLSRQLQTVAAIAAERPVFLRAELPQSSVEELGVGFIENQEDVYRIAAKANKGILLRDAHRVNLKLPELT